MIHRGIIRWISRCSVTGLGVALGSLAVLHFAFETDGRMLDLLKVVIPLFLSFGVLSLGLGLARGETDDSRIGTVGASGFGGMVLLTIATAFTIAIQRLEGSSVPAYWYLVLSNASIGAVVGTVLGVYRVRLRQRTEQLAEEVHRLNEFAGIVAHDLRNPLHIAQGYVSELPSDGNEAELAAIERAHARMERLIEHVLSLSRQGDAVGETTTVDIGAAARTAWDDVPTDEAELRIVDERPVEADERRLRSLLENLFRNAVEHGGSSVTVTVGAFEGGFYVADDGPGVPPERRERIFEGGYSSDESGTGLGLAIVREIADAHDWSIAVEDSDADGARFEFRT